MSNTIAANDKLRDLQEQKNRCVGEMEGLTTNHLTDDGWEAAEYHERWDQVNAEYAEIEEAIRNEKSRQDVLARMADIRERQDEIEEQPSRLLTSNGKARIGRRSSDDLNPALKSWWRSQVSGIITPQDADNMRAGGIEPGANELVFDSPSNMKMEQIQQAVRRGADPRNTVFTTATEATGGATVPSETFIERIEMNMLYFGPMRQVAEIVTTSSGEQMTWPMVDDTASVGEILTENTNADNSGSGDETGTWAQFTLQAYKFSSKALIVPYELLEDARGDFVGTLSAMIGERLGRITNTYYTTGTGSSQPTGVETAASTGKTAAAAGSISDYTEIVDLEHSVDVAYRNERAGFMMHDLIIAELRKLQDANGRPIYSYGLNVGQPDTLCGRPIYVNNDMTSTMATTTTSVLFGDFTRYKIRRVNGMRFYRLTERYRHNDQDGFIAFIREDGGLLDAGTDPVKALVHP